MLLKTYNILVVDDVVLMSNFMYGIASRIAHCRVFKAFDGKAAAEILESESIDLLITDLEMKSPSGLELVYRVRSNLFSTTNHDIPIIIFSGNTYIKLIKKCVSFDVNDFLAKPVSGAILTDKILYHLGNNKKIFPSEHYYSIGKEFFCAEKVLLDGEKRLNVSIVRDLMLGEDSVDPESDDFKAVSKSNDFLYWPGNATTGYVQIDRRLRNLAYYVSCLHRVFVNNGKTVAVECERKRASDAIDYLLHIIKNCNRDEVDNEFWQQFDARIEKLKPLAIEFYNIDVKHHSQIQLLLKKTWHWWMHTCNRRIIKNYNIDNDYDYNYNEANENEK